MKLVSKHMFHLHLVPETDLQRSANFSKKKMIEKESQTREVFLEVLLVGSGGRQ